MSRILILEDEERVLFSLYKELNKDFEVETASNIKEFDKLLRSFSPEIVVMDIRLPDGNSIDYIKEKKLSEKDLSIILISGYPEEEYLIEGLRMKVEDFIKKPFSPEELKYVIKKVIKSRNIRGASRIMRESSQPSPIYRSSVMKELIDQARTYAKTNEPVLIIGETGTGKQVLANLIHSESQRASSIMLDVNCATISETLLESQLFGHKKGAFTDAKEDFKGFFELTDGGSLFLDEISEMKPELQAKLLKVVENQKFIPLGSNKPVSVDVRLITATNRDLEEYIKEGKFREDLFYRLNVLCLKIPPLRARKDDIAELANFFLIGANRRLNKEVKEISDKVLKEYREYPWPGNVRELKNVINRAVLLCSSDILTESSLSSGGRSVSEEIEVPDDGINLEEIVQELEKKYIEKALIKAGGSQSKAAKLLGITRDMLRYRLKSYNIKP